MYIFSAPENNDRFIDIPSMNAEFEDVFVNVLHLLLSRNFSRGWRSDRRHTCHGAAAYVAIKRVTRTHVATIWGGEVVPKRTEFVVSFRVLQALCRWPNLICAASHH